MKKLQGEFKKSIFDQFIIERTESKAIYSQSYNNQIIGYEVFKIKIAKDADLMGRFIQGGERYPSDNDFGISAWSIRDYDKALSRYSKL